MRSRRLVVSALCLASLALQRDAYAAEPEPAPPAPTEPAPPAPTEPELPHRVSLTFSPAHLFFTFFELQAELRVSNKFGFALILGAGITTDDAIGADVHAVSVGLKSVWYAIGDFEEGMQVAFETMDIAASATVSDVAGAFGNGFSLSPLLGYKDVLCFGLTFEVQAGPAIIVLGHEVSVVPNVNLNIGWSF